MPRICIPKEISQKLLSAAKQGKFTIHDLTTMTSDERHSFFSDYMDGQTAQEVNGLFERALVSTQKNALKNWAVSVFTPSQQKTEKYKNVLKKINQLDELGLLSPESSESFMRDLVAEKLGVSISAEEAKNIHTRAAKLEELSTKVDKFGLPTIPYLKARRDMYNYLNEIAPSPRLRIMTSTIARGNLLFSIKSPMTNIIGNTVMGIQESFTRRLAEGRFNGSNTEYALEYVKNAVKVFRETGYDITRTVHLDDTQKTLGEENISSQGEGKVRKVGRFYEDFVFKGLMATPDVAFSATHFADSANIASTKIAGLEGLKGEARKKRALEIFKDATRIDPLTEEGQLVRSQAMADAMYATFQNDSYYSTFALAIRKMINTFSGDIRLGDQLMPFVKTPANVIGVGVDAAGVGAIRGLWQLRGALEAASLGNPQPLRGVIRDMTHSGLGLTLAFIVASMFDPEDYIGEYPTNPKEQELLRLKRASTNSIRIGGKWVSLDYFGAIAAPLVGIMYARKYGNGMADGFIRYAQGVGAQVIKIPAFEGMYDILKNVKESVVTSDSASPNEKAMELLKGGFATVSDFIASRVVPAIVYDLGKASDEYEREYNKEDAFEKIMSRLPFIRESLPVKKDVLGDPVKTESAVSQFLFGARVKTANQRELVTELSRLSDSGNLPAITDVAKTSSRVKEFKLQRPDKYDEMLSSFKTRYADRAEQLIKQSSEYRRANDEKKAELLNAIRTKELDEALKRYGYRKPPKTGG